MLQKLNNIHTNNPHAHSISIILCIYDEYNTNEAIFHNFRLLFFFSSSMFTSKSYVRSFTYYCERCVFTVFTSKIWKKRKYKIILCISYPQTESVNVPNRFFSSAMNIFLFYFHFLFFFVNI